MDRFANISNEQLDQLLKDKDAKNTIKQTEMHSKTFSDYLRFKDIHIAFETVSKETLDAVLSRFWVEVRQQNGSMYKVSSFNAIRAGVQRKFKQIRGDSFDIINDISFGNSNSVFNAQKKEMKRRGLGKVEHYRSISEDDMTKLYESGVFDVEQPLGLLRKVFFELLLHLCRRGQENLRELTADDFKLIKNKDGTESVIKISDEVDKNHTEDAHEQEDGGDEVNWAEELSSGIV